MPGLFSIMENRSMLTQAILGDKVSLWWYDKFQINSDDSSLLII